MKRPRYYCERCHTEVRKDAKICPRCGRFFSSVKCPRCGHVGRADDFAIGCPVCGYADPARPAPESPKPAPLPLRTPWWAYPLAGAVLLGLALLLLETLR